MNRWAIAEAIIVVWINQVFLAIIFMLDKSISCNLRLMPRVSVLEDKKRLGVLRV